MAAPRFYARQLAPGIVTLDDAQARHLRGPRRMSDGDEVVLFNGRGDEGFGRVGRSAGRSRGVHIVVERVEHRPRPCPRLTLATALPKGPRQDWLIEKCTELAVSAIQPLVTRRSVAEASAHRLGRWRQIAIEAAKQASQAWLPDLYAPLSLPDVLAGVGDYGGVYVASGAGLLPARAVLWPERVLVLIGPEGDWTAEELDAAQRAGARAIRLGPSILRIETAAVSVAALVHACMGAAMPDLAEPGRASAGGDARRPR